MIMSIYRILAFVILVVFLGRTPAFAASVSIEVVPKKYETLLKNSLEPLDHLLPPHLFEKFQNKKLYLAITSEGFLSKPVSFICPQEAIENFEDPTRHDYIDHEDPDTALTDDPAHNHVFIKSPISLYTPFDEADPAVIYINKRILPILDREMPSCYHKNYKSVSDYLVGQVIKKFVDFVLSRNLQRTLPRKVTYNQLLCEEDNEKDLFGTDDNVESCSSPQTPQFDQFDMMAFSYLDKWNYPRGISKNTWSADPLHSVFPSPKISKWELFSPKHSLLVNTERFLTDPDFSCRKPATHLYLKKLFRFAPFGVDECPNLNTLVYDNLNNPPIDLNPKLINRIYFLLAGPGKLTMSLWGHSLFRLSLCPKTNSSEEECTKNSLRHLTISYRGYVRDGVIRPIKGLLGQYPSLLFVQTFSGLINEYLKNELRDLTSLPINFTEDERKFFVYKILEDYWTYRGRYYFINNNCATEANDLLISGFIDRPHKAKMLQTLIGSALTPIGSFEELLTTEKSTHPLHELFDVKPLKNKKKMSKKNLKHTSYKYTINKMLRFLIDEKVFDPEKRPLTTQAKLEKVSKEVKDENKADYSGYSLDNFYTSYSAEERRMIYERAIKNPKYRGFLGLFRDLELYFKYITYAEAKDNYHSLILKSSLVKKDETLAKYRAVFIRSVKANIQVYPFKQGYGIPSRKQVQEAMQILKKNEKNEPWKKEINRLRKILFERHAPKLFKEFQSIKKNIRWLLKQ